MLLLLATDYFLKRIKLNILTDLPKRPLCDLLTCHMTSRPENSPYLIVCVGEKYAHELSVVRSGGRVRLV